MASISQDPNSDIFYIRFRYNGRNINRSLGTKVKQQAQAIKFNCEERVDLLDRGSLSLDVGTCYGTLSAAIVPVRALNSGLSTIGSGTKPKKWFDATGTYFPIANKKLEAL
jgi:hypothetical protein